MRRGQEDRVDVRTILAADTVGTDEALCARAGSGDVHAFELLYRAHAGRVLGVCVRMTDDREEAEGLAQDVWVRVWERLGSFRGQSAFTTWLHSVTVNLVVERRRKGMKRRLILERWMPEWMTRASTTTSGREEGVDLRRAVARLPEGARNVFLLHDVEGYKHREIAVQLGIAEGTVKAQLHRARRLLREALS